jgi:cell division septation protein DedD
MPVTEEGLEVEEAEAPPDTVRRPVPTPTPTAAAQNTVDGFRVQVFASQSQEVAEAARRTAQARLGVPAYSELADGVYKVRVGDCLTRETAETLLSTCRAVYYKDAWIVESKVLTPAGN